MLHHIWNLTESDKSVTYNDRSATAEPRPSEAHQAQAQAFFAAALTEGCRQLRVTKGDAERSLRSLWMECRKLPARAGAGIRHAWNVANAPVRLPGWKPGKKRTKLQLFLIDTVRFGGTFAVIFGVLFAGLNAHSYWQIAKAELAIGGSSDTEEKLQSIVDGSIKMHGSDEQRSAAAYGNILGYLPDVGPFEDRLVIPRIGKNIPIVRPSLDALMREDWKQFEEDIQASLRDGVVHYPGSAKPGQAGNFFVTGHSSYYPWDRGAYKDVFARLGELQVHDTYSVYYGGDKHTYRIIEKKEVKPSDVSVLDQPTNKRLSTLMTCTPIGTTLRRLILVAEEIDPATGLALNVGEHETVAAKRIEGLDALPM